MGRRGPPPKPTKLKILSGNPGKRPLNDREPTPAAGVPKCPPTLDEVGKDRWRWLVKVMGDTGVLTQADAGVMERYCRVWSRWLRSAQDLDERGEVLKSKKNGEYQNPWLAIHNKANEQLDKLEPRLGLDPSSRSRLSVPGREEEADTFEQMYGGGAGRKQA